MTELNNLLISVIESQMNTIQLLLNNLKRHSHSHSIPDKEIQEKINNNEEVCEEHDKNMIKIQHLHHHHNSIQLDELINKSSYELHTEELHKLFPKEPIEPLGKEQEQEEEVIQMTSCV